MAGSRSLPHAGSAGGQRRHRTKKSRAAATARTLMAGLSPRSPEVVTLTPAYTMAPSNSPSVME